jgi:hypothetical protein
LLKGAPIAVDSGNLGPDVYAASVGFTLAANAGRDLRAAREIHMVPELPKTRSGKIMRRLLRDVAEGRQLGDISTLLDPNVFHDIART